MHTKKCWHIFFINCTLTKKIVDTFFKMCKQLLFKSGHKNLKSAYKNHTFCRNGTPYCFTTPETMWTLIMKLPDTEVKFYPEVKSQTGLCSLQVSCKRAPLYGCFCIQHNEKKNTTVFTNNNGFLSNEYPNWKK